MGAAGEVVEQPANQTGAAAPPPPPPPAAAPPAKAAPPPPAAAAPPVGAPAAVPPPASSEPPAGTPDGANRVSIDLHDLGKRIGKAEKKTLREVGKMLGLPDFKNGTSREEMRSVLGDKVKALSALETAEAERQRAALTEKERFELEKQEAERTARHATRRMEKALEKLSVKRWDSRVKKIAAGHVAVGQVGEVIKILKTELRTDRHLRHQFRTSDKKKIARRLDRWFEAKAKSNPAFAKDGASPPAAGAPPPAAAPSAAGAEDVVQKLYPGKTMVAGKPNSLTATEVAAVQAHLAQPPAAPAGQPITSGAPPNPNRVSAPPDGASGGDIVQRLFPGKTMKAGLPNSLTSQEVAEVQRHVLRASP